MSTKNCKRIYNYCTRHKYIIHWHHSSFPNLILNILMFYIFGRRKLQLLNIQKTRNPTIVLSFFVITTSSLWSCLLYFLVDDKQPLLLVDYLEQTKPLLYTITLSSSELYYDHIRHGNNATRKTCLININDFVEKSVYFSESQNTNYYFRFPTLCHSS